MPDLKPVLTATIGLLFSSTIVYASLYQRLNPEADFLDILLSTVPSISFTLMIAVAIISLFLLSAMVLELQAKTRQGMINQSDALRSLEGEKFSISSLVYSSDAKDPVDMFGSRLQVGDFIICLEPKFSVLSRIEALPTGSKGSTMVSYSNGGTVSSQLVAKLSEDFTGELLFKNGKTYKSRIFPTSDKPLTSVGA